MFPSQRIKSSTSTELSKQFDLPVVFSHSSNYNNNNNSDCSCLFPHLLFNYFTGLLSITQQQDIREGRFQKTKQKPSWKQAGRYTRVFTRRRRRKREAEWWGACWLSVSYLRLNPDALQTHLLLPSLSSVVFPPSLFLSVSLYSSPTFLFISLSSSHCSSLLFLEWYPGCNLHNRHCVPLRIKADHDNKASLLHYVMTELAIVWKCCWRRTRKADKCQEAAGCMQRKWWEWMEGEA